MKNDSQWLAEARSRSVRGQLETWDRKHLNRLQSLLESLIIESREETVQLAESPDTKVPKIRIAAGRHQAYERLLSAVKGVLDARRQK